jgi:predicted phage-related endonuclease
LTREKFLSNPLGGNLARIKGELMANAVVLGGITQAERVRKVSNAEAELVAELVKVRAEISALESRKSEIAEVLNKLFGKQETESEYDLLINRNRELVRMKWKSRPDVDKKKLAENYPDAFEKCQKVITYAEIVTLHK